MADLASSASGASTVSGTLDIPAARIARVGAEAVVSGTTPRSRIARVGAEAVVSAATPRSRISRFSLEMVRSVRPITNLDARTVYYDPSGATTNP